MSKFVLVALVAVLAVALADDTCSKCQTMCANARTNFNNDFSSVTTAQLVTYMESQCKAQFSGFEATVCKSVVDSNGDKMLAAFKRGDSNQQICAEGSLC